MSKSIPTVQKFMTCEPYKVEGTISLSEAQNIMKDREVRHLPVIMDNQVYGILSDRDIKYALGLLDSDPQTLKVKDVCHTHIYATQPNTPVDKVADEMAEHHYGCAVIVDNSQLVGIFTTVDACKALSTLARERVH